METNRVHEIVHGLREKPQHVRENVAIGVAGGTTLVVALGWFIAMSVSGTFTLAPSNNIASETSAPQTTSSKDSFSNLLGAAGAAMGNGAASSTPAVTIVDTQTTSTLNQEAVPANVTVIHF